MVGSKPLGLAITVIGLSLGTASAQTAVMMNGRLVPYIPHVIPAETSAPPPSKASPTACPTFLRTNPDILGVVNGYAQGSARNPRMTAAETVSFIASSITAEVRSSATAGFNRNPKLFYDCLANVDRRTIADDWPTLNAVIVGKEKREAVEAEAQRQKRAVEQERQRTTQAALQEQARKQAAIDALPANRLLRAYRLYIGVKQCAEARRGYAVVYLTEEQAADAKARVVAIEKTLTAADPSLDSDAIWSRANGPEDPSQPTNELAAVLDLADAIGKRWVSSPEWVEEVDGYCDRTYAALTEQFTALVPDARTVKKDF